MSLPWSIILLLVVFLLISIVVCILSLAAGAVRAARRKPRQSDHEEARIMQEIYQGLSRMEDRVESLETIILEKEEDRSHY